MIVFNWKLVTITIIYLYTNEVQADRADYISNDLNKLSYWQRDPALEDGRRMQKKQTITDGPNQKDKYLKTFQAVHNANESNSPSVSSDQSLTTEYNQNKHENQQETKKLLHIRGDNNNSSAIVWQRYVEKDEFKSKDEDTLKYTKSSHVESGVTKLKQNTGLNHIHFKKMADSERIFKWKKVTVQGGDENHKMNSLHPSTTKNMKENSTKYTTKMADLNHTKLKHTIGRIRRWSNKVPDKTSKANIKKGKKIDMFNKNYLLRNRLKHRNKVVVYITSATKSVHTQSTRKRDNVHDSTVVTPINLDESKEAEELKDDLLSPYAIMPHMTQILSEFKNANVTTEIIGRSAEYNDIVLFKISALKDNSKAKFRTIVDLHKYDDTNPEKKIVFIVHGLTVMGMNSLACLSQKSKLKILLGYYMEHLDKFDIFLIPMANPDGYASSARRIWNKNMSPQADCKGVMLDRNFDIAWNSAHGISSCSQGYPGPAPFSEIESKAISTVFHFNAHRIHAYIHVHAGTYDVTSFKGDAVLYPRGHTDVPGDDDKYYDIKGDIDESLRNASFRALSVTTDTLYHWYGMVTGSSVDYADQVFGITYAMEFVMQLYEVDMFASKEEAQTDHNALTHIWSLIIGIVFKHLGKSIGHVENDDDK